VVLTASITTKSGKCEIYVNKYWFISPMKRSFLFDHLFCCFYLLVSVLVLWQYVDVPRIRLERLLVAFPKLVHSHKQHRFVETDEVRYVYQLLEGLCSVLITCYKQAKQHSCRLRQTKVPL
jgi:hypothetical protein